MCLYRERGRGRQEKGADAREERGLEVHRVEHRQERGQRLQTELLQLHVQLYRAHRQASLVRVALERKRATHYTEQMRLRLCRLYFPTTNAMINNQC